jgi:hypothetical protein
MQKMHKKKLIMFFNRTATLCWETCLEELKRLEQPLNLATEQRLLSRLVVQYSELQCWSSIRVFLTVHHPPIDLFGYSNQRVTRRKTRRSSQRPFKR